nr:M23 family metallopeptidase [Asanoa iriomotensis]
MRASPARVVEVLALGRPADLARQAAIVGDRRSDLVDFGGSVADSRSDGPRSRLAAVGGAFAGSAVDGRPPEPTLLVGPVAPRTGFDLPVAPPLRVTRPFDAPARPWLPGHRGVDLASEPGATVWAAGPGEVVFAGPVAGRTVVSIQHANGLRTTYEPVTAAVRRGDRVATGDPIGTVEAGHAGCPVTACLHWGLRREDVYLNPLLLLGFRVRLLPL